MRVYPKFSLQQSCQICNYQFPGLLMTFSHESSLARPTEWVHVSHRPPAKVACSLVSRQSVSNLPSTLDLSNCCKRTMNVLILGPQQTENSYIYTPLHSRLVHVTAANICLNREGGLNCRGASSLIVYLLLIDYLYIRTLKWRQQKDETSCKWINFGSRSRIFPTAPGNLGISYPTYLNITIFCNVEYMIELNKNKNRKEYDKPILLLPHSVQ